MLEADSHEPIQDLETVGKMELWKEIHSWQEVRMQLDGDNCN